MDQNDPFGEQPPGFVEQDGRHHPQEWQIASESNFANNGPNFVLKIDTETSDQGASCGTLSYRKPAAHHGPKRPTRSDENYVRNHINSKISAPKPFHDLELVEQTTPGRQQECLGETFEKNDWEPDPTLGSAGRALCQNFQISGIDCDVSFDGTELILFSIDEELI